MKKQLSVFILMVLIIALLAVSAVYGISAIGLKSVFDEDGIRMGLDLVGGSSITYEAQPNEEGQEVDSETMDAVIAVLRNRVTNAGYTEATVTKINDTRVKVEIPSISNPEEAVQMLGTTAKLKFVDSNGKTVVEGSQVKSAKAVYQASNLGVETWMVSLELDDTAVKAFADATQEMAALKNSGANYISIFLDDVEISRPFVDERINSKDCVISGNFDATSAENLANLISSGNLPVELKEAETRSVGATLGAQALTKALTAGAIGIILVIIFMLIFYRLPGLVSSLALIGYIALTGICLVAFNINLSLPGIAGVFLTIGMAVDANIVIFERIKEELNAGKSIKSAVKSGFNRAFTAVLDSNITTLIAALVLWYFGTGPIQGFAITLGLGVILSMLSAVLVTKIMLNSLVDIGVRNIRLFGAKRADNE